MVLWPLGTVGRIAGWRVAPAWWDRVRLACIVNTGDWKAGLPDFLRCVRGTFQLLVQSYARTFIRSTFCLKAYSSSSKSCKQGSTRKKPENMVYELSSIWDKISKHLERR